MTINKTKSFILISGVENRIHWEVRTIIFNGGRFSTVGHIIVMNSAEENREFYLVHQERIKERGKKWREENHEKCLESQQKYRKNHKDKYQEDINRWRENNPEKYLEIRKRAFTRRQRNLGFHKISFSLEAEFDWHHVNKNDVVAIPRWIHREIRHKLSEKNNLEGIIG